MKTIEEIFSTNPLLLDEPEVKELIEQFKLQFNKCVKDKFEYKHKVIGICFYSNLFTILGYDSKEALTKILDLE